MKIRPYQEDDQESVIALWFKCNLVVPWNNPASDIKRKLEVNSEMFLVGVHGDQLIATVMGGYEGHRGWINYLAVDPDFQGQDFGKQMMTEIEEKLLAVNCPKVQLQVRNTNTRVIDFYKAIGYKDDNVIGLGKRLIKDEEYNPPGKK